MHSVRQLIVLFLLPFFFCNQISANTNEADDAWRQKSPVTSHLKNVVVVGMPKEIAIGVAIWAESVIEEIENWSKMSIPGSYAYPIVIDTDARDQEKQGFVIMTQEVTSDGHLRQGLTIVNREVADAEDLLEGLCHLLLNRWIHARQSPQSLYERPGQFPHWFTYGIAQSLYPDLMYRNRQLIKQEEVRGRYLPALSVVSHLILPPGRWPEKAHAGLVMRWTSDRISPVRMMNEAADAVAKGLPLDKEFVIKQLNFEDSFAYNAAWDLWMAKLSRRIVPGVTASDTDALSRLLEMHVEDLGLAHPAVSRTGKVSPVLLIAERDEKWARDVCQMMVWRLRLESVGKVMVIQDAVKLYLDIFDLILKPPQEVTRKTNKRTKKVAKPPTTRELNKMWRKADKEWHKLVKQTSSRKAYVDDVEDSVLTPTNSMSELLDQWQERLSN